MLVELFFILSGFGMFLGYAERITAHTLTFKDYMIKRLKKLYPLFLFSTIVVTLLQLLHSILYAHVFIYPKFTLWYLFLNLTLCQTGIFTAELSFNGPEWSLTVFFILYIMFYIIMYHTKSRNTALYAYAVMFLAGVMILTLSLNLPFLLNNWVGRGLICFPIGVLLAMIYQESDKLNTVRIGYISLLLVTIFYLSYRYKLFDFGDMRNIFIMVTVPAAVTSVLYIPWLNRLFSARVCQYLGSLSFEIYLLHFPVQTLFRDSEELFHLEPKFTSPAYFLLYVLATITCAVLYKSYISKRMERVLANIVRGFRKTGTETL